MEKMERLRNAMLFCFLIFLTSHFGLSKSIVMVKAFCGLGMRFSFIRLGYVRTMTFKCIDLISQIEFSLTRAYLK